MAPASPLTGGIQAIRRSVPPSAFTGKAVAPSAVQQPDTITTNLLSRNNLVLNTVSMRLSSVSQQIQGLNQGLSAIRNNLAIKDDLDRQQAAAEAKRERQLAQIKLREGKEGAIEKKIQNALLTPVRKIGAKVQFTLNRLSNFFTILLTGWITLQTIDLFKAISTGNTEKLNEIKGNILGNLAFVGGTLFLLQGGLVLLSAKVAKLGFKFLKFGAGKLFGKPLRALTTLLSGKFAQVIGNKTVQTATNKVVSKGITGSVTKGLTGANTRSNVKVAGNLLAPGIQVGMDVAGGKDVRESVKDTTVAATSAAVTTSSLRKVLPKKFKLLADLGGIISWIGTYAISDLWNPFEESGKKQQENLEGNIMPSVMVPITDEMLEAERQISMEDVQGLQQPKREDFGSGRGGAKAFQKAKKEFNAQKVELAKNITPVNKQRSIAANVDTEMDEGPQFIPMPMGSGGQSGQSASNASGSAAGGDSGIPNVPASNSMFRSYQLVAKKHFQVV
tara:strand:+ start:5492 stop:7000 length:1509 start_codon:yes stop_codon:yes gene_type:complete